MSHEVLCEKGQIIRAVGGKFCVKTQVGEFFCDARSRHKQSELCVGDFVEISIVDNTCVVEHVLPRKNKLVRPYVANVDLLVCVLAPVPKPDLLMIDKLLIASLSNNMQMLICVNKTDLDDGQSLYEELKAQYHMDVLDVVKICCIKGDVAQLQQHLKGRLSCLAGQSAVGKTSLINTLLPEHNLKVGDLSKHINRGKHTTRETAIFQLECGGAIVDTPGFSKLYCQVAPQDIRLYFNELLQYADKCKYAQCTHINEPECGVLRALEDGKLLPSRYERYKKLFLESGQEFFVAKTIMEKRSNK